MPETSLKNSNSNTTKPRQVRKTTSTKVDNRKNTPKKIPTIKSDADAFSANTSHSNKEVEAKQSSSKVSKKSTTETSKTSKSSKTKTSKSPETRTKATSRASSRRIKNNSTPGKSELNEDAEKIVQAVQIHSSASDDSLLPDIEVVHAQTQTPSSSELSSKTQAKKQDKTPHSKATETKVAGTNSNYEDTFLVFNKPLGMSSFGVVSLVKKHFNLKKVGHAGTLDPLATGVLVLATGNKTKEIESVQNQAKSYTAEFLLGAGTNSDDAEEWPELVSRPRLTKTQLKGVLQENFWGSIWQVPAQYSAIKLAGKRAYEIAKNGLQANLEARPVNIYEIELDSLQHLDKTYITHLLDRVYSNQVLLSKMLGKKYKDSNLNYLPWELTLELQKLSQNAPSNISPLAEESILSTSTTKSRKGKSAQASNKSEDLEYIIRRYIHKYFLDNYATLNWSGSLLKVHIKCSKGTYIRSIARDLGQILGSKCMLVSLKRISVGNYNLQEAIDIKKLI